MKRRIWILGVLIATALGSAPAHAQRVSATRGPWYDRFGLEPYAGAYFDNAGRSGASNDSGWLGGVRVSYAIGDRVRLLGDVGYSRVDAAERAGGANDYVVFGSENWLLTGGIELDVVPGDTRGSLSLQAGNVWRDLREEERFGNPEPVGLSAEYSPGRVLVPGFAVYQRLAPRADLRLGVQDYIFFDVGNDPISHNFALSAGVVLR